MKFRSITTKTAILYGVLLFVVCAGLGLFAFLSSSDALKANIDQNLLELAQADARVISEKMDTQLNALEALANSAWIKDKSMSVMEKRALLMDEVERSGHISIMLVDTKGITTSTDGSSADIHEEDYFIKALTGENAVSDPTVSKTDGSIMVTFAVPIKEGGKVIGVLVARRDGNELSTYTNEMMTDSQEVFMINSKGVSIANKDQSLVAEMYSVFNEVKENPALEQLYNIQMNMAQGESGAGQYTYKGVTKYLGYYPVEGTDWSLGVTAPKSVVMARVNDLTISLIVISAFVNGKYFPAFFGK